MATTSWLWAPSFSRVHAIEVIDVDIPQLPKTGITLDYYCFYYTYNVHYNSIHCLTLSFLDAETLTSAIAAKGPFLS